MITQAENILWMLLMFISNYMNNWYKYKVPNNKRMSDPNSWRTLIACLIPNLGHSFAMNKNTLFDIRDIIVAAIHI